MNRLTRTARLNQPPPAASRRGGGGPGPDARARRLLEFGLRHGDRGEPVVRKYGQTSTAVLPGQGGTFHGKVEVTGAVRLVTAFTAKNPYAKQLCRGGE